MMKDHGIDMIDYWDQKTIQMEGMWCYYYWGNVMNGMINEWWILNIYWMNYDYDRELTDYWDQKTLQMGGMW